MRHLRSVAFLALLGLFAALHALPATAADGDAASGNFTRPEVGNPSLCLRTGFSASTGGGSTGGSFTEVEYNCSTGRVTGDYARGIVTCLTIVGNTAYISGPITSAAGFFAGVPAFAVKAIDNSTPSSPNYPDRASSSKKTAVDCSPSGANTTAITSGDIRVQPSRTVPPA
jgi:hypothetical protein